MRVEREREGVKEKKLGNIFWCLIRDGEWSGFFVCGGEGSECWGRCWSGGWELWECGIERICE